MYSFSRRFHPPHVHHKISGLTALTLNYIIVQLGLGMVGMFSIIYIFELGETLAAGLRLLFAFLLLQRVTIWLIAPAVGRWVKRFGYRRVTALAQLMFIGKLLLLALSQDVLGLLWAAAIVGAIAISAYYISFHGMFVDSEEPDHVGRQIGAIDMAGRLAAIVAPAAAGLIIAYYGYSVMFGISTILMFAASVPLAASKSNRQPIKLADAEPESQTAAVSITPLFKGKHKFLVWAIIAWHIEDIVLAAFWPVYFFLILRSYALFGVVGSIVTIISAIIVYLAGVAYDRRPFRRVQPLFAGGLSGVWLIRWLSVTPMSAAMADVIHHLTSPFWWMKIRRRELLWGKQMNSVVFGVVHEQLVTIGVVVGLVSSWVLMVISGYWWPVLLIPTTVSILGSSWLLTKSAVVKS